DRVMMVKSGLFVTFLSTLGLVAATEATARAQNNYPAIIDQVLKVNAESIDAPSGCQLCHTDPSGGTISLRPSGQLLVSTYGLQSPAPAETQGADDSLRKALAGLQTGDPKLVMDLQMGIDPNVDVTSDPVPMYGC